MTRRAVLAAAAVVLAAGGARAQQATEPVAALAMPAVRQFGTARVMGLDAAYVGIAEGAAALQWNPAGLGMLASPEAGWHHAIGLGGTTGETLIVGVPVGRLGGLAAAADYVDNGSMESRDEVGNLTGHYGAGTVSAALGWGTSVADGLYVGAAARAVRQTLAELTYTAVCADAGVLWRLNAIPGLSVGAAAANLGSSGSGSSLASSIRAGASLVRNLGGVNRVLAAVAADIEPGGLQRVDFGVEDTIYSRLALRAGYRVNLSGQQLTGLAGLTAGLGVTFGAFALDYAYLPFGDLGTSHRVGLTYRGRGTGAEWGGSR